MTGAQTHLPVRAWLDAMAVALEEAPPRRRLFRPLAQRVDLRFVRANSDDDGSAVDPRVYDALGHAQATPLSVPRTGRLLNVRV